MTLETPVEQIPKINPRHAKELRKLEINTVSDLLFYFPYRHEDFSNLRRIADVKQGDQISVRGIIKDIKAINGFYGRINRAEAVVSDDSGSLAVVWFNQSYLANSLKKGDEIFLSGTARFYKTLQLQNPVYEKINAEGEQIHTARIVPIYRLTANLALRTLRALIYSSLAALHEVKETLPEDIIKDVDLLDIHLTIKNLHFPDDLQVLEQAKRRMAFEEIFNIQKEIFRRKQEQAKQKAIQIPFNKHLVTEFIKTLPFELTPDQKNAAWEILQDLEKATPMNRLLEGDVGSGKTLVAFIAALETVQQNNQAVLLCPTEILAKQHYQSAMKYLEGYPHISLVLLTSKAIQLNGKAIKKAEVLEEIKHGGPQFIISTHAILQKEVELKQVALIIIDEQHRFGVKQREAISEKQKSLVKQNSMHPHTLSMTATPIPRTLQMAILGDVQVSQIKRLPAGRKPVKTKFVAPHERSAAYIFINKQISEGRQVFVVTPLIEESDRLGVKAATTEKENLQKIFPRIDIDLLHGRMKSADKEKVMQRFLDGQSKILVSTSIIEVGIDVPNASVMVIEGADRFGLAELHQFRGRVGRAEHQSYCFLFTESENPQVAERLESFSKIQDGFKLAEIDLENRGFGNILGQEQSGFITFKFFDFRKHQDLAEKAKELITKN